MPFKLGNLSGSKIYLGNTEIVSAFKGTEQVYSSGPPPFELGTVTYDNVSLGVSNLGIGPKSLTFNNDGTKLIIKSTNNDRFYQYSLSVPFNVGTASYDNVFFRDFPEARGAKDMKFNNDGTKMLICDSFYDYVISYTLSTPFSISSASYDNVSFSVSSQAGSPTSLFFNTDGTKMFLLDEGNRRVYQYTLSTAFNIGTLSYDNVSFDISIQEAGPQGLAFNNNGTKMFITGQSSDKIHQYTLPNAFDLSSASYDNVSFSVSSQDDLLNGLAFNNDGTKIYVAGNRNLRVYQYTNTF